MTKLFQMAIANKKTTTITAFFTLLVFNISQANVQSKKDSLLNVIESSQVDTIRIKSIIELANTIGFTNSDSSILLYNEAIQITENKANQIEYLNLKALAQHKLGNHYLGLGKLDDAMEQYNSSAEIRTKTGDKAGLANILNNKGIIYSYTGEIEKSRVNYNQSLELRIECNDSNGIAGSYANIGILYQDLGEIDSAITCFNRSIEIHDMLGNEKNTANIYNNLGVVYKDKGDIANALHYYNKSLEISKQINNESQIASVFSNIGMIYKTQGDNTKALDYYERSLELIRKLGDARRISYLLQNIGGIYFNLAQKNLAQKKNRTADSLYNEALMFYKGSLEIKKDIGDKPGIAASFLNIGIVYEEMVKLKKDKQNLLNKALVNLEKALQINQELENKSGLASTYNSIARVMQMLNKDNTAMYNATQSYQLSKELGYVENIKSAAEILNQLYEKGGNFKLAHKYYKEHIAMRDSLAKEEDLLLMQQKYYQYEYEKKAAADSLQYANELQIKNLEIQKQHERVRKQRTILIASILGFLIVLVFSFIVLRMFRQKRKANILLNVQNIQIQEQKKEIEKERDKSDNLLLNILPRSTADELKKNGHATPKYYKSVSVLFTDFKGFTKACAGLTPEQVVRELHMYFEAFDNIAEKHGLEKIKTIGDSYMCAGGLPEENNQHPIVTINAALEMQEFMDELKTKRAKGNIPSWELRVGIHTGEIIAGVVGKKKFAYDIWGNTVNIASRMETACEPGKVNISESTYSLAKNSFKFESRGKIEAKNVGAIEMYFVNFLP